jgi:uncharacterized protein
VIKFVLLALLIGVVLWLLLRVRKRPAQRAGAVPGAEDMVVCAHCGVHLPRSEALLADGRAYCGALHRDAGPVRE